MGHGYVALEKNGKSGVLDIQGKTVVPFKYKRLFFERGRLRPNTKVTDFVFSSESEKWAQIRLSDAKQLTSYRYDFIEAFDDNQLTTFKIGDKWGVLDREGRELIPAKYEKIRNYDDLGILAVCQNGHWGVVNKFGTIVIPVRHKSIYIRTDMNIAAVNLTGKTELYDADSFELIRP
jgi:hypothetical protein